MTKLHSAKKDSEGTIHILLKTDKDTNHRTAIAEDENIADRLTALNKSLVRQGFTEVDDISQILKTGLPYSAP
jgi:hypothetical protein